MTLQKILLTKDSRILLKVLQSEAKIGDNARHVHKDGGLGVLLLL